MIDVKEILRLWLAGVPKQRIVRTLSVDRKTAGRYIELAPERGSDRARAATRSRTSSWKPSWSGSRPSTSRPRGEAWERCVQHRAFITQKLEHTKLSKARRLLRRKGIHIPYPTLHRLAVTQLGYGRRACTIPVADGEPGGEVQLDTGWVGWLEPDLFGKRRRFRAWIFTSVRSRHRFVWPVFRETTASAIEACEEAWMFFGGAFHVLIPYNTSAIVD